VHRRAETRRCSAICVPAYLAYVDSDGHRTNLTRVVLVEFTRWVGDAITTEARRYLSTLPAGARLPARTSGDHGGIENGNHRVLGVAFREDRCRIRSGRAQEDLAILRHVALDLVRRDCSVRGGVATRHLRATLNHRYLRSLVGDLRA
jgi:hypothetical protein